jgi:hypothetical protein
MQIAIHLISFQQSHVFRMAIPSHSDALWNALLWFYGRC